MKDRFAYWMVGCSLFMVIMGTNVPSTLYGVYRQEWGFSASVLTLVFATYVAGLIPSLLLFGHLSDYVGRRTTVLSGLLAAVVGIVVFLFAGGVIWLFAARFVQGIAVGIFSGAATAALAELQPDGDRKAAALMGTVMLTVGGGLGPIFGAVFAEYLPGPLIAPYIVYLAVFVPLIVLLFMTMPETVDLRTGSSWRPHLPGIPGEIAAPFLLGAAACFLVWAIVGFYSSLMPSYIASLLGTRNLLVGGGLILLMFASSLVGQLTLGALSSHRTITAGCVVTVAGLAALVAAETLDSGWILVLASVLSGVGVGFGFRGGMEVIGSIAPADRRAEVLSAAYVILYSGVGIPTVLVGFASDGFGLLNAVVGLATALCLLAVVVTVASMRGPNSEKYRL